MLPGDIDWNIFNREEGEVEGHDVNDYDADIHDCLISFEDGPGTAAGRSHRTSNTSAATTSTYASLHSEDGSVDEEDENCYSGVSMRGAGTGCGQYAFGVPVSPSSQDRGTPDRGATARSSASRAVYFPQCWSERAIQKVIDTPTDPVGKFLRDLRITPADAVQLNIMPFLERAPRKPREKYGKRRSLSDSARAELSRARNREHARSTRQRRKVFEDVLRSQLRKISAIVQEGLSRERQSQYVEHRLIRAQHFQVFVLHLTTRQVDDGDSDEAIQHCITPLVAIHLQLSRTVRIVVANDQRGSAGRGGGRRASSHCSNSYGGGSGAALFSPASSPFTTLTAAHNRLCSPQPATSMEALFQHPQTLSNGTSQQTPPYSSFNMDVSYQGSIEQSPTTPTSPQFTPHFIEPYSRLSSLHVETRSSLNRYISPGRRVGVDEPAGLPFGELHPPTTTILRPLVPTVETYRGGSCVSMDSVDTVSSSSDRIPSSSMHVHNVMHEVAQRVLSALRSELLLQTGGRGLFDSDGSFPAGGTHSSLTDHLSPNGHRSRYAESPQPRSGGDLLESGPGGRACDGDSSQGARAVSVERETEGQLISALLSSSSASSPPSSSHCVCERSDDMSEETHAGGICLEHLEVSLVPVGEDILIQGHVLMTSFEVTVQVQRHHSVAISVPGQFMVVHFGGADDNFAVEEVFIDLNVTSLAVGLLQAVGDCRSRLFRV